MSDSVTLTTNTTGTHPAIIYSTWKTLTRCGIKTRDGKPCKRLVELKTPMSFPHPMTNPCWQHIDKEEA